MSVATLLTHGDIKILRFFINNFYLFIPHFKKLSESSVSLWILNFIIFFN